MSCSHLVDSGVVRDIDTSATASNILGHWWCYGGQLQLAKTNGGDSGEFQRSFPFFYSNDRFHHTIGDTGYKSSTVLRRFSLLYF